LCFQNSIQLRVICLSSIKFICIQYLITVFLCQIKSHSFSFRSGYPLPMSLLLESFIEARSFLFIMELINFDLFLFERNERKHELWSDFLCYFSRLWSLEAYILVWCHLQAYATSTCWALLFGFVAKGT
jgi:hypothetical protein